MKLSEFIEKTKNHRDEYLWIFDCENAWYKVSVGSIILGKGKIVLVEDTNKKLTDSSLKVSDIVSMLSGLDKDTEIELSHKTPYRYTTGSSKLFQLYDEGVAICSYSLFGGAYTKELV